MKTKELQVQGSLFGTSVITVAIVSGCKSKNNKKKYYAFFCLWFFFCQTNITLAP
jgi:hypothetical protein